MTKTVYITVGKLDEKLPIMPLVLKHVEEGEEKKVAKALRFHIAKNISGYGYPGTKEIAPGKLWWAVFSSTNPETSPICTSENYLWRGALLKRAEEAEEKRQQELQRAIAQYQAGSYDPKVVETLGVFCPKCGCYSIMNGYCSVCSDDEEMREFWDGVLQDKYNTDL